MYKKLIIDSSVILKWLNQEGEKNIDEADEIMEEAIQGSVEIIAPELARYEVGNALLKGKQLTPKEGRVSLSALYALPITFVTESEDLAIETFSMAYKFKATYYDASFLALAKKYSAVLITENTKHQGKTPGIKVVPLKDYCP